MHSSITGFEALDEIVSPLLGLMAILLIVICWQMYSHSKESVEHMTYLDIHVYKKMLRGLSICFGATYIVFLLILLFAAYRLINQLAVR